MLTAEKKVWFDKLFSIYNRNLVKRRFHALRVENFEVLNQRDRKKPLLIYANHSSWWDGLIIYELLQKAKIDGFVIMEEKQLQNLQFFRKIGAFSVIRENPREAVKSINYAVELLNDKENRALLIFPQGEIKPNDRRPLEFYNGISRIAGKLENCHILPVALRYEFLGEFKPEVFVKIGDLQEFKENGKVESKGLTKKFEIQLTNLLDNLRNEIAEENAANYKKLL